MSHTRAVCVILLLLLRGSVEGQIPSPPGESSFREGELFFRDGAFLLAFDRYQEFRRSGEREDLVPSALYNSACCLLEEGRWTDALIAFRELQRAFPHHELAPPAELHMGDILLQREEYAAAKSAFLSMFERYNSLPIASDAMFRAGECARRQGNQTDAVKYFTIAYEHRPAGTRRDEALFCLGLTQEQQGEWRAARTTFERLREEFPNGTLSSSANTHIGVTHFFEENYLKTLSWLEQLTDSPDAANAAERLYFSAEATHRLGQSGKAEKIYGSFLSAYPRHQRLRQAEFALAGCLLEQRRYTDAIALYDRLMTGNDEIAESSRLQKAAALLRNNQTAQAEELFATFMVEGGHHRLGDRARWESGRHAYAKGQYAKAVVQFQKLIAEYPASPFVPHAESLLGDSYASLDRPADALDSYSSVGKRIAAPAEIRRYALFRRGMMLAALERHAEAAEAFDHYLVTYPEDSLRQDALQWKGEMQYGQGRYAEAILTFEELHRRAEGDVRRQDALYALGRCHAGLQQYADAEKLFTTLTKTFRGGVHDVEANMYLGDVQQAMGHFLDAATTYRYASRMYPNNPRTAYALLQLALVDYKLGQTAPAINTLKTLLERHPESAPAEEAKYYTGWLYLKSRDYSVALSHMQRLLKEHPKGRMAPYALYHGGEALYHLGNFKEAERQFRALIDSFPSSPLLPDALQALGECLRKAGDQSGTAALTRDYAAMQADRNLQEEIRLREAARLYAEGRFEESLEMLERFRRDFPETGRTAKALFQIAQCHYSLNHPEKAIGIIDTIAARYADQPVYVDACLLQARIAGDDQQFSQAVTILSDLLARQPSRSDELLFLRAIAYRNLRDMVKARTDFEKAARRVPMTHYGARARIQLASLTAATGDTAKAMEELMDLTTQRRDAIGAEAQTTIGNLYLDRKQYRDAERELLKVETDFPQATEACASSILSLGICYQLQGAAQKARAAYRRVIEKYPNSDAAAEAGMRLNRMQ